MDWCWNWSSNTVATWFEKATHWKRPWCWERLRAGKEGDSRDEMVRQHHWLSGYEYEQTRGEGPGSLACYSPWGCRVGHDLVTKQQQQTSRMWPREMVHLKRKGQALLFPFGHSCWSQWGHDGQPSWMKQTKTIHEGLWNHKGGGACTLMTSRSRTTFLLRLSHKWEIDACFH